MTVPEFLWAKFFLKLVKCSLIGLRKGFAIPDAIEWPDVDCRIVRGGLHSKMRK